MFRTIRTIALFALLMLPSLLHAQSAQSYEKVICYSREAALLFIDDVLVRGNSAGQAYGFGCEPHVADVNWGKVVAMIPIDGRLYKVVAVDVTKIDHEGDFVDKRPPLPRYTIVYEIVFVY